jgi:hypothetical protein
MDRSTSINGVVPSWADLKFSLSIYDGRELAVITDISALNWASTVEVGEKRGAGGILRGHTRGQPSYEASATFYADGWVEVEEALAEVNRSNISLVRFSILALWTPPGTTRIHRCEIDGARVIGDSSSNAEGVDPSAREITFAPLRIISNGTALLGGTP